MDPLKQVKDRKILDELIKGERRTLNGGERPISKAVDSGVSGGSFVGPLSL